jgi:uncharacterized lipoprotein YmbA
MQAKLGVQLTTVMVVGLGLIMGGCSFSQTPNYYTLSTPTKLVPNSALRVIEVFPVSLPDRLDRVQMVVQDPNGQAQILDLQRWTSTLSSELHDGLSSGLQQRLGAVDRYNSGMATTQPVYRIGANFSHFDLFGHQILGGKMIGDTIDVAVTWSINRLEAPSDINAKNTVIVPPPQLACRMSFHLDADAINSAGTSRAIALSRESINRVSTAVAASIMTYEGGAKPSDAVCI